MVGTNAATARVSAQLRAVLVDAAEDNTAAPITRQTVALAAFDDRGDGQPSHSVNGSGTTAAGAYVPGTRGRESNTFYVVATQLADDTQTGGPSPLPSAPLKRCSPTHDRRAGGAHRAGPT